jgi:hypothetical protein
VVDAEVDCRDPGIPVTRDLLAQEEVAREEQTGLGREPRQRDEEKRRGEHDAERIAVRAGAERGSVPADRDHGQEERDRDAERRKDIDEPGVEVVLVEDARDGGDRAERDRRPDERGRAAGDRGERNRRQRDRVVGERERPREAARQDAGLVDVVKARRRQPRVGDERRGRLEPDQAPDCNRFP